MSGLDAIMKGMEKEYDNSGAESFIVFKVKSVCKPFNYQVRMAACNKISHVIPFEVKYHNDRCFCYYNITSKLPLKTYLKRRKLTGKEFIGMLSGIAGAVANADGYLLNASGFVTKVDYMYINPATLDVQLIYLPFKRQCNVSAEMRELVIDLILNHAVLDDGGGDNYIQKILNHVRNDVFNVSGFCRFLDKLIKESEGVSESRIESGPESLPGSGIETDSGMGAPYIGGRAQAPYIEVNAQSPYTGGKARTQRTGGKVQTPNKGGNVPGEADNGADNIFGSAAAGHDGCAVTGNSPGSGASTKNGSSKAGFTPLMAIVLEIMIAGILFAVFRYMSGKGSFDKASFAASIIIAAAAQVLIIRRLIACGFLKGFKAMPRTAAEKPNNESNFGGNEHRCGNNESICENNESVSEAFSCEPVRSNNSTSLSGAAFSGNCREAEEASYNTVMLTPDMLGRKPYLVDKCNLQSEKIIIDKEEFLIGRLEGQVDYRLNNSAVGKIHAGILTNNGRSRIIDYNSVNGTFIDGKRIDSNKEYEITSNCTLTFANCEFLFFAGS